MDIGDIMSGDIYIYDRLFCQIHACNRIYALISEIQTSAYVDVLLFTHEMHLTF